MNLPVDVDTTVDDIDRILALSKRPPFNCRKENGQYEPRTQALVELITSRFSRGTRLSCACRPRVVQRRADGSIIIFRIIPDEGLPPEPPIVTTVEAFVADQSTVIAAEVEVAREVSRLRPGGEVRLPAFPGNTPNDSENGHFCIKEFNGTQAWVNYEVPICGGGIGFEGVGCGKSASFLTLPLAFPDIGLAVLLIEPNQRDHYEEQYLRVREHFRTTSIIFEDRPGYTVPGTPPLHLVSYSKLGHPNTPDTLDRLNPDLLLADEAHRLSGDSHSSAARRRVRRYIAKRILEREAAIKEGKPVRRRAVYFFPASGTLEDDSIEDTQQMSAHGLGDGSPLPIDGNEAKRWSLVMDPVKKPDLTSTTSRRLQEVFAGRVIAAQSIASLIAGGNKPEEEIRRGFQKRRTETIGVITATASTIGASIYFEERKAPKMPQAVREALTKVREEGLRPDGDLIVEQTMQKQIAREVALGFYYYWAFLNNKCTCPPSRYPICKGCLLIEEWFLKRKAYGRELRDRLLHGEAHLDSPKLCMNAAVRAIEDTSKPAGLDAYCVNCRAAWPCGKTSHLPAWVSEHWPAWGEIRNKVQHEQRVRWIGQETLTSPAILDENGHIVGEYMARDAAAWAQKNKAVLWYINVAFGEKVAKLAGLPCHGGGPDSETAIRAETGKRSIVASLKAWGKGLDGLQNKFAEQFFLEMPSSNRIMEQALGRLHRLGQRADVVKTHYYAHVQETRDAIRKVLTRAEFNQAMTGNPALILFADGLESI